jgi:uncharacterized membrane protein YccC
MADNQFKAEQLKLDQARIKAELMKSAAQIESTNKAHMVDVGVDVMKHLSDKRAAQQQHHSGNQHDKDMQQQQHMHQTLQAVMAARQQSKKPTKGE